MHPFRLSCMDHRPSHTVNEGTLLVRQKNERPEFPIPEAWPAEDSNHSGANRLTPHEHSCALLFAKGYSQLLLKTTGSHHKSEPRISNPPGATPAFSIVQSLRANRSPANIPWATAFASRKCIFVYPPQSRCLVVVGIDLSNFLKPCFCKLMDFRYLSCWQGQPRPAPQMSLTLESAVLHFGLRLYCAFITPLGQYTACAVESCTSLQHLTAESR